jgi:hypothetical protein
MRKLFHDKEQKSIVKCQELYHSFLVKRRHLSSSGIFTVFSFSLFVKVNGKYDSWAEILSRTPI